MYQAYWGLKEKPFENTPDPRFIYYSSKHEEALMRLLYAVREKKGAAMLSGEYGSGKTLLSRVVVGQLMQQEDEYKVALVVNPAITSLQLLGEILYQLGEENSTRDRKIDILRRLNEIFYKTTQNNKHTVIVIDEAQTIEDDSVFEELRLLLNFQLNERFLLTLILLGQPELRDKIDRIPQLKQRLSVKYHLEALDFEQTREYIQHRCRVAGREDKLFSDEAIGLVYTASRGIPREINNLCDMALVIGFGERTAHIDGRITQEVIRDFKPQEERLTVDRLIGEN